jgi:hypothetical protein
MQVGKQPGRVFVEMKKGRRLHVKNASLSFYQGFVFANLFEQTFERIKRLLPGMFHTPPPAASRCSSPRQTFCDALYCDLGCTWATLEISRFR